MITRQRRPAAPGRGVIGACAIGRFTAAGAVARNAGPGAGPDGRTSRPRGQAAAEVAS